ncbi:MAG TPA: acylneuraminate cytidylyltransferase family protein [Tepidisphaeraceae bacterium]|jgi:CMP-N-acetylneuraminic acid synthetase|nr:acylneuraminate cytidylyltransferase family protein [Tepidisphaeraceae bacterium]
MNVLGVILARAGSQGLKSKHMLPLLGRSVISYTFDHAQSSKLLTRVVVSTDCPQIRHAAEKVFLETVTRPPELATSDASVQAAMLHAMHVVEKRSSFRADALVVLYGNVPVRGTDVIDRSIRLLEETKCDSVRTFCPVGKWHPAWMSRLDGDRVNALHAGSIHRRQDLKPLYLHDGASVAVSRASMLRGETHPDDPHAFFGEDRRGILTEMGETVEIDHLRDLYWAEAVLRERGLDRPQRKMAS